MTTPPSVTPESPAPKKRSPIERAVVWGGIAILLVVAGMQFLAWNGFRRTLKPLQAAMQKADESEETVTEAHVKEMLRGNPTRQESGPRSDSVKIGNADEDADTGDSTAAPDASELAASGASRIDTYTWKGLFRSYVLRVYYGIDAGKHGREVLNISAE